MKLLAVLPKIGNAAKRLRLKAPKAAGKTAVLNTKLANHPTNTKILGKRKLKKTYASLRQVAEEMKVQQTAKMSPTAAKGNPPKKWSASLNATLNSVMRREQAGEKHHRGRKPLMNVPKEWNGKIKLIKAMVVNVTI
jgi:hypothetical protein